ncbi:MAG: glycosyltransferase family 4 protein [Chloroflexi bacterium]|nr:glycosyltransferase family 4 protein [Chloroflexota bacterium]
MLESEPLWVIVGLSAIVVTAERGVSLLRGWALRHQMLDIPGVRRSHSVPTPRGGGLAIVIAVLAGTVFWVALGHVCSGRTVVAYVAGGLLVAGVSWLDDCRSLPASVRLCAHATAAALVVWRIGYWRAVTLPLVGEVALHNLGAMVTFVWIIGLINAYNFMDGIDGIAGSQAVVAGVSWIAIGNALDMALPAMLGALVAAASIGFLLHNWPPARIFMGDVGSAFLGFTFAVLGVIASDEGPRMPVTAVLAVGPFVLDATTTLLRRLALRENVFEAHRSHLYQRLVVAGWSHRSVTCLYLGLATVSAATGVLWALGLVGAAAVGVLLVVLSFVLVFLLVKRLESAMKHGSALAHAHRAW